MLAARLEERTTVFAVGSSVVARNATGQLDRYWQSAADASCQGADGDLYAGLIALPGPKLTHDGPIVTRPGQ